MQFFLAFSLLLTIWNSALANEFERSPEFLIQTEAALPSVEHDSLVLSYYSKQFDGSLLDKYSKEELIQLIKGHSSTPFEKGVKATAYTIPFGPSIKWEMPDLEVIKASKKSPYNLIADFKLLQAELSKESLEGINRNLETMSEAELRTFLSKKYSFLKSVGSGIEMAFAKVKLKPPYKMIQGTLNSINNLFFQKSEQFLRSNTIGVPVFVTTGIGATLGKILYDVLIAKTPLKNKISPNFGFYFASSVGLSISKIHAGQKSAWVLDLFFDFETLKRAFLPVFEVNVGGGFGFHMETRQLPEAGKRVFAIENLYKESIMAPLIGTIKTGQASVANQHSFFFGLPFSSTLYETYFTRKAISIVLKKSYKDDVPYRSLISDLFDIVGNMFKGPKLKTACMQFYSL